MDERVTPNFWLSELIVSDTAVRLGIPNTPGGVELTNIRNVLAPGLEKVRAILGKPVLVSSGYRSPALNKAVGGAKTSQHLDGLAADFRCPGVGTPLQVCRLLADHGLELGWSQLIQEGRWVHIGFPPPGRPPALQVLTAHFDGGAATYSTGLS